MCIDPLARIMRAYHPQPRRNKQREEPKGATWDERNLDKALTHLQSVGE